MLQLILNGLSKQRYILNDLQTKALALLFGHCDSLCTSSTSQISAAPLAFSFHLAILISIDDIAF
jgi:hypothetical protein